MVAIFAIPRLPTPTAMWAPACTRDANCRVVSGRTTSPRTSGMDRSGKCWRTGSMRGSGMISGYRLRPLAADLPKFVLVLFHPHTRSMEDDAFSLETQSLFQAVFARERDLSLRAYNTMPRQPAGTSQCPNHLTGAAGKARRARDLAVGRYF